MVNKNNQYKKWFLISKSPKPSGLKTTKPGKFCSLRMHAGGTIRYGACQAASFWPMPINCGGGVTALAVFETVGPGFPCAPSPRLPGFSVLNAVAVAEFTNSVGQTIISRQLDVLEANLEAPSMHNRHEPSCSKCVVARHHRDRRTTASCKNRDQTWVNRLNSAAAQSCI